MSFTCVFVCVFAIVYHEIFYFLIIARESKPWLKYFDCD